MKIRVVGHTGMLGREVAKAVARMRHELVVAEGNITERWDKTYTAEVVINCAGLVTKQDSSPAEMMLVNGYGPWNLADWCDQIGARLIHVSTDCVFDDTPYSPNSIAHSENSDPQPATPYGWSKLAGEVRWNPHLTVRTSFVGHGNRGLIAELMQLAKDDKGYWASRNLHWTGHTTRFVAEVLVMLAERKIHGLLHVPGETMTRYELVLLLRETLGLDLMVRQAEKPIIDRRLGSGRWEREGLPELPSFEWQLEWLRRSQ